MAKDNRTYTCPCGWHGKLDQLKKNGSVTHSDEWWECPACGLDGSNLKPSEWDASSLADDINDILKVLGIKNPRPPGTPIINDFIVASSDALVALVNSVNPVMLKESLACVAAGRLTFNQFNAIQRAAQSAAMRSVGCSFCGSAMGASVSPPSKTRCEWCLCEREPKKDRTHEQCEECRKQHEEPQTCLGHAMGESPCPEFKPRCTCDLEAHERDAACPMHALPPSPQEADQKRLEWLMDHVNADRDEIDKRMRWEKDEAKTPDPIPPLINFLVACLQERPEERGKSK